MELASRAQAYRGAYPYRMSDQIVILREAPEAWGARLEQAYAAGEIAELPFMDGKCA